MTARITAYILAFLICGNLYAQEGKIYLYTMFHDDNSTGERFRTVMKDMEQCLKVLEKSKLPAPETTAGDYEVMGAMWCGGDMERNYNAVWWSDKEMISNK
jgi:hypothetical protein